MEDFELEHEQRRSEIATYLRTVADGLERDTKLTFISGEQSATLNPPETVHFRVETSSDSAWLGGDEGRTLRFEMGWEADEVEAEDELRIVTESEAETTIRDQNRS